MNTRGELTPKERNRKWNHIRAKLKKHFQQLGITHCEMCGSSFALSFAHRLKRRFITTVKEMYFVSLLCVECHEKIEHSGHEQMFQTITTLITQRSAQ